MSFHRIVAVLAVVGLSACSTRPREFTPALALPPADQAAFAAAYDACQAMVAEGQRENFKGGRTASAAMGAGTVVGAGVAGTAVAGYGGLAIVSGGLLLAPVAIWGGARMIRGRKEKEIKEATAVCLKEHGYEVSTWERSRPAASPPA